MDNIKSMEAEKLRAWWWARQGLDGSLVGVAPRQALLKSGWARSVGGANPYMSIFARSGATSEQMEKDAASVEIQELPSARGCTYVLPKEHYALGLTLSQGQGDNGNIVTAKRFLGVTEEELDRLSEAILRSLEKGPLDPRQIKDAVGDAARSLGDEGKKRGTTSTLPLVLGRLQSQGFIRRVPMNGRLDQQRFRYALWQPNPLAGINMTREEALTELGRLYFSWIGPATQAHFQWFSGTSGKAAKEALAPLSLQTVTESGHMLHAEDVDAFHSFKIPTEPTYNLVSSLDATLGHRREVISLLDDSDMGRQTPTDKSLVRVSSLMDLYCNAILDRGRLVGLWEYEPSKEQVVWTSFVGRPAALKQEVARTETFIREQLGDCRSFSLDSPESRVPRLNALKALAEQEATPV
jgi:hypothetical protein